MLGLVTCSAARELDTDLPLLIAELPEARIVTWDDPTVEWSAFGAVVIRSTWDYLEDDPAGAHQHIDVLHARGAATVRWCWSWR